VKTPDDASEGRGVRLGPFEAQAPGDILQAVGIGREVEMGEDDREDVHERAQGSLDKFGPGRSLPHAIEEVLLEAAVAEQAELAKSLQFIEEESEDPIFLVLVILYAANSGTFSNVWNS
jgi:hypothetical protein